MKTVAIIQARMGSTRLPGKILKDLHGKSVLGHVIERVRAAAGLEEVVVATTTHAEDDAVVAETRRHDARIFRGSETDVLARYYFAARDHRAGIVVRVTSDCPLFDPQVLGQMLDVFGQKLRSGTDLDYLSNTQRRTYPRGLDAEILTMSALEQAHHCATLPYEREHVTPYIYQHPELFRLFSFENNRDLSTHRWTLDTPEDWRFIEAVYAALGGSSNNFSTTDVLQLLGRQPELALINADVTQKKLC